jgi:hypothetical protein
MKSNTPGQSRSAPRNAKKPADVLGGYSPPSLFALTIAQSGERKSSCDAPLMAALRAFEREQAKAQREEMTRWHNAQALWKGERDRIMAEAKSGKGVKRIGGRGRSGTAWGRTRRPAFR